MSYCAPLSLLAEHDHFENKSESEIAYESDCTRSCQRLHAITDGMLPTQNKIPTLHST